MGVELLTWACSLPPLETAYPQQERLFGDRRSSR